MLNVNIVTFWLKEKKKGKKKRKKKRKENSTWLKIQDDIEIVL